MDHSDTARERPETDDQATAPEGSTTAPTTTAPTTTAPTGAPAEPQPPDADAEPAPGGVTSPVAPSAPAARFTLHRSRTDRMISGVSGGLAESLAVDPTLVRLGFVALALVGFPLGFVLYVAIWMLAPER